MVREKWCLSSELHDCCWLFTKMKIMKQTKWWWKVVSVGEEELTKHYISLVFAPEIGQGIMPNTVRESRGISFLKLTGNLSSCQSAGTLHQQLRDWTELTECFSDWAVDVLLTATTLRPGCIRSKATTSTSCLRTLDVVNMQCQRPSTTCLPISFEVSLSVL